MLITKENDRLMEWNFVFLFAYAFLIILCCGLPKGNKHIGSQICICSNILQYLFGLFDWIKNVEVS